jgi:Tfp pilus assembly protein PilO
MMARVLRALAAMPARQLHLLGGGVLLVLAATLWTVVLRAPLAQLRTVRAEQQRLENGNLEPRLLAAQLARLDGESAVLAARLGVHAPASAPAPAQMLVGLVGDVNRLALAHGVSVAGVTPAPDGQTLVFDQLGFEAQASGSYDALLAWMAAIEAAQPNLAIASFDMAPAKTPGQTDMKIRIAAYRPQEGTP